MTGVILVAIAFVQLTGPDGRQRIDVNPNEVTSIREPRGAAEGHWAPGTKCLVVMTSGKFIAVSEDCMKVREEIGRRQQPCALVCGGAGRS